MKDNMNIKIVGAGPTGSVLALMLSNIGCKIILEEKLNYSEILNKERAYAINHSSMEILNNLGIWKYLNRDRKAFETLIVKDDVIKKSIFFERKDLPKRSRSSSIIGWVLEHKRLMEEIYKKIYSSPNITLNLEQETNYSCSEFDFVIAADGSNSLAKEIYSINSFKLKYNQACLTTKILLRGAIEKRAYEILRKEGPFAILPIGGDAFQIVWTDSIQKCKKLKDLPTSMFLDYMATFLPKGIEPDAILTPRQCFPVSLSIASIFFNRNCILVGESAHNFHPVGGQGLNICWRDALTLAKLIKYSKNKSILHQFIPQIYFILRLIDVLTIGFITDSLIRIYSNSNKILLLIRLLIVKVVNSVKPIKKAILYIMTRGITLL